MMPAREPFVLLAGALSLPAFLYLLFVGKARFLSIFLLSYASVWTVSRR